MKKKISFQKMSRAMRGVMLCACLWFSFVFLTPPAGAQVSYATPFTFSTLAGKAFADDANRTTDATRLIHPKGLAVDTTGNVYVANTGDDTICRITPAGIITVLAGRSGCPGSADGTGSDARFCNPQGVAVDDAGNIYVADSLNNTIRRVTPSGVVTTLAGRAHKTGSADGVGAAARFDYPKGIAVDSLGNIYVADLYNSAIRKVTPEGSVTTLAGQSGNMGNVDGKGNAAQFNAPVGVAVDSADNVYVLDASNNAIRLVTPSGMVTTLAGQLSYNIGSADGTGRAAQFNQPYGITVDNVGNVYVADTCNDTIRQMTPAGMVTTLGGLAGQAGNADGLGSDARFSFPLGIAVDRAGNLYVADSSNAKIRKGVLTTPALSLLSPRPSLSSITQ